MQEFHFMNQAIILISIVLNYKINLNFKLLLLSLIVFKFLIFYIFLLKNYSQSWSKFRNCVERTIVYKSKNN